MEPKQRARRLLALSLAAMAAVNGLDFPLGVRALRALGGGEPILDMRPGFDPAAAFRLLDALGPLGRTRYLQMLWTIDLALPALFAATLWTALGLGALRRWRWLALCAGAADYLENGAITLLLARFPVRLDAVARVAGTLTAGKFVLYSAAAALAVAGVAFARRAPRPLSRAPEAP